MLAEKVFPQHIQVEEQGATTFTPQSIVFNITIPVFKLLWPFLPGKKVLDQIFVDSWELKGWADLFFPIHPLVANPL